MRISITHSKLDRVYEVDVDKCMKKVCYCAIPVVVGLTGIGIWNHVQSASVVAFQGFGSSLPANANIDNGSIILDLIKSASELAILKENDKYTAARVIAETFRLIR